MGLLCGALSASLASGCLLLLIGGAWRASSSSPDCVSSDAASGLSLSFVLVIDREEKPGRKPFDGRERIVAAGELIAVRGKEAYRLEVGEDGGELRGLRFGSASAVRT